MTVQALPWTLAAVEAVRASLQAGDIAIMAAGPGRRLALALQAALQGGNSALVIGISDDAIARAYSTTGGRAGRVASLGTATDAAEIRLRLAAYEAGTFDVLSITPHHLWHAEVSDSLRHRQPDGVILDLCGDVVDLTELCLRSRSMLSRARQLVRDAHIVVLVDPMSPARTRVVLGRHSADVAVAGDMVPPNIRISFQQIRSDTERNETALKLARTGASSLLFVAPARGAASRLAERLRAANIDTGLYHGGLSHTERRAILHAQEAKRLRILVSTEAIVSEPSKPCPDSVVLIHPPVTPDAVLHFTGLAADAQQDVRVTVLWSEKDLGNLSHRALARTLTLERLRECEASLRSRARSGYALAPLQDTIARFAEPRHARQYPAIVLHALELSGMLERRDDVPRGATVTLKETAESLREVLLLPKLRTDIPVPVDMVRQSSRTGVYPDELQRQLLDFQRNGRLNYRGHGRERMYVIHPPRRETFIRARIIVAALAKRSLRESQAMIGWLTGTSCRVQYLRTYLGGTQGVRCGVCDRCARPDTDESTPYMAELMVALNALAAVPFQTRPGVARRIVSSAFSDVKNRPTADEVRGMIEALERIHLVERLIVEGGAMLVVSAAGHRALDDWRTNGQSQ